MSVALAIFAVWLMFAAPLMRLPHTMWIGPGDKKQRQQKRKAVLLAPYIFFKLLISK